MKRMQYFSLLVTGICLPVFADPVLKVGTFQSKGASLEQPSLVEGNKRVGLRELYGSMFAGQDFKIWVYAGKEEICRIYFLGKFRGSWGFPFKAIPGKEKGENRDRPQEEYNFVLQGVSASGQAHCAVSFHARSGGTRTGAPELGSRNPGEGAFQHSEL